MNYPASVRNYPASVRYWTGVQIIAIVNLNQIDLNRSRVFATDMTWGVGVLIVL